MARQTSVRWLILFAFNVLFCCVLGFYQTGIGAPAQEENGPFANSVQQRMDTIALLKEINAELKAQTALLRSGNLKVVVSEEKKR